MKRNSKFLTCHHEHTKTPPSTPSRQLDVEVQNKSFRRRRKENVRKKGRKIKGAKGKVPINILQLRGNENLFIIRTSEVLTNRLIDFFSAIYSNKTKQKIRREKKAPRRTNYFKYSRGLTTLFVLSKVGKNKIEKLN